MVILMLSPALLLESSLAEDSFVIASTICNAGAFCPVNVSDIAAVAAKSVVLTINNAKKKEKNFTENFFNCVTSPSENDIGLFYQILY